MINPSIKEIKDLGLELEKLSKFKRLKYPFNLSYVDGIIDYWKRFPGKHLIQIFDCPDNFIIRFNKEGIFYLLDYINQIKKEYGLDTINRKNKINFYLFLDSIKKNEGGITIKIFKNYIGFISKYYPNFDGKILEKRVIEILPNPSAKSIKINGFPIDLKEDKWAIIFGVMLDSHLREFNFVSQNGKNYQDLIADIKGSLDNIGINYTEYDNKNIRFIKGHSILGHILFIGGINSKQKQLFSNNALPHWLFTKVSRKYHSILLSKFLDTEGCSPFNKNYSIRIAQSSLLRVSSKERKFLISKCKNTKIKPSGANSDVILFSKLNDKLKEKVVSNPPLILVSIQLLLRKYSINSILYPQKVYISSNGVVASGWHLNIQTYEDLKRFYNLCSNYISIPYKKERIEEYLIKRKQHLPKRLRLPYFLSRCFELNKKFTSKDLMKLTHKKQKGIVNILTDLSKIGYITNIEKKGRFKVWNLTNKAIAFNEKELKNVIELI